METKYYFPIDSKNLPHYLGCACLKPSRYFVNRIQDVQNMFDEYLLITSKMGTSETDCSLELVLTKEEEKNLFSINDNGDIFLFNKPFPITRVKSLFFKDDEIKDRIITTINLGTAFIPPINIEVIREMESVGFSNISLPKEVTPIDWSEHLKQYDRILGGFALMQLGGEEYMNYSTNYMSTLSFFNSVVATELINLNKNINTIYYDIFVGKEKFKQLFRYLNKEITENDLEQLASEEKLKFTKNKITGLIDINILDNASYILAVLLTYGVGEEARRKKIDGLIAGNFKGEIKPDKSEIISLFYGLNRGYSVFSNKYNVAGNEKIVKFKLDSQLDYYTIESIYQFAFNGITQSGEFQYLDGWCPKLTEPKIINKNEYLILDKLIIGEIIKVGSLKWWSNFLQEYFHKDQVYLFKPFLEKCFNKISSDIHDEIQEDIDIKNDEIQKLKKENKKLLLLKDGTKQLNELVISLKNENSILHGNIQNFQNEIEILKQNLGLNNEQKVGYDKEYENQEDYTHLKSKLEDINILINKIDKLTNIKDAKKLIKEFNSNSTLPFIENK